MTNMVFSLKLVPFYTCRTNRYSMRVYFHNNPFNQTWRWVVRRFHIVCFAVLIISWCFPANTQGLSSFETDIRQQRKPGLSLQAGGPLALGGLSLDVFLSPQWNLDMGVITLGEGFAGVDAGFKYHWLEEDPGLRWSPYIGAQLGYVNVEIFDTDQVAIFYLPVGVQFMTPGGFNLALEVAFWGATEVGGNDSNAIPWGSVKIGYRFARKGANGL